MVRKKNLKNRRLQALENLRKAQFFEKGNRTQEKWEEKRQYMIKVLEERTS